MKKVTKPILKRILAVALCMSLCMSLMTAVAMASEGNKEIPPATINLLLSGRQEDESEQIHQNPDDQNDKQIPDNLPDEQNPDAQLPHGDQPSKNDETNSGGEQPAGEQPAGEQPAEEQPTGEQPTGEQPTGEQPTGEQPAEEQPAGTEELGEKAEYHDKDKEPTVEVQDPNAGADGSVVQQDNDGQLAGDNPQETENPEAVYSEKGQTADGHEWEMTKDATTGKYTLTITFPHSEGEDLNITEDDLKNIEQYAAEVSAALAAKYGSAWEWDSTMDPSGNEDINMFQVLLSGDGDTDHTYRYDSDKLEQMDGEFVLEKVDESGNLITDSEATFQLWHVNEIIDPDTSETVEVKMYCSYDAETNTYTFVPTESTIQTINGRLEIFYAMMKDVVYYLQEVSAPDGYEVDPAIHIIMEKELWEQEEESFRNQFSYLGEFTEDEDGRIGLDVKFVDVKSGAGDYTSDAQPTPVDTPDEAPMQPPVIPDAEENPWRDPNPVENPIPITEEQPEIPVNPPVVNDEPQNNETDPAPVNVSDIPETGDILDVFLIIAAVSAVGLIAISFHNRKKTVQ